MSHHQNFSLGGDTGINTVEGNLAGHRAAQLTKKREKAQKEFEAKKQKIKDDVQRSMGGIEQKFKSVQKGNVGVSTMGMAWSCLGRG